MDRFPNRKRSAAKKVSRVSRQENSDITWSGEAWICNEQLKHYPAFCRSDTKITAYSFVYVMSKKGKDHVAYVQDLYENEKGDKIVSVRWFNSPEEVENVETHSKEVFITPFEEDISVECINGVATVLTPNHFQKCLKTLGQDLSSENFVCHREVRDKIVMPFSLSELEGYSAQPIVSSLMCEKQKSIEKGEGSGLRKPAIKVYERIRRPTDKGVRVESSKEAVDPKIHVSEPLSHVFFMVNDNIEVLSQDSGIRGCWFRCKVLRSSQKRLKVQHCHVLDVDGPEKLEEWVPCQKVADQDKLGMRFPGRLTVRPWPRDDPSNARLEVGGAVDAWCNDGWWEGVIIGFHSSSQNSFQVYFPGENTFLTVKRNNIRISKDWVDGKWMNINPKADILSFITSILNPMPKLPPLPVLIKPPEDVERQLASSSKAADLKSVDELNFKKRLLIKHNDGAGGSSGSKEQ